MAGDDRVLAGGAKYIDFQTDPSRYRHWKLAVDGDVATLTMDVDENGGLFEGYQLKLNSYDLGVDIELADAVQRLRQLGLQLGRECRDRKTIGKAVAAGDRPALAELLELALRFAEQPRRRAAATAFCCAPASRSPMPISSTPWPSRARWRGWWRRRRRCWMKCRREDRLGRRTVSPRISMSPGCRESCGDPVAVLRREQGGRLR